MPTDHARLSPSAAERWLVCPASIQMAAKAPPGSDVDSVYAREGTAAHSLGESKARTQLLLTESARPNLAEWDEAEMDRYTDAYVALLRDKMQEYPGTALLLEQRMNTGVPHCWGTGDAVLVSPQHVEVVDLKYGAGVAVSAYENPQLMLYGLGALDTYGDLLGEPTLVRMTIFQPRIGDSGSVSSYELTPDELRAWRADVVLPRAEEALGDNPSFGPGEKACRWCPAAGVCRPRMEAATRHDFATDPNILDAGDIGALMGELPAIRQWCDALEAEALDRAYSRAEEIPGWKVVLTRGRRSITNSKAALERLMEYGYSPEDVGDFKPKTLGALEKLVGRESLSDILGDAVTKSEGKPSLVAESDPRPAVNPNTEAAKEFGG